MKNGGFSKKHNRKDKPKILLYSTREQISGILTVGLIQRDFRVLNADTPFVAATKTNQLLPDLVVLDIPTAENKEYLIITRLQKLGRTKQVPILVIAPKEMHKLLGKIIKELKSEDDGDGDEVIHIIEYPFRFADLLKRIMSILSLEKPPAETKTGGKNSSNAAIGERLFDLQIPVDTKYKEIERTLLKQWAFPFTVVKALDIIGAESSCCKELGKCIETDLAAASSILRVANTVYYGKRQGRVSNVSDAVVRLGFHETRNLLSTMALIRLSSKYYAKYRFARYDFWLHSLATAVIAEKLCVDGGHSRPAQGFLSGLIHDLGKIPLDNNFDNVFPHLLEESSNRMAPFADTERYLLGFTHADLGHYLTTQWYFPYSMVLSVRYHHNPEKIISTGIKDDRLLQESVYTANIFAKALNLGYSCDEVIPEIPEKILKDLKILEGPKDSFFDSVYSTLSVYHEYLKLPKVMISRPSPEARAFEVMLVYGSNTCFHPVEMALKTMGFFVKVTRQFPKITSPKLKIAVFIPDDVDAIDLNLSAETNIKSESILKVFLIKGLEEKSTAKEFKHGNVIIVDRNHLDLRFLLHAFDRFLGEVVVPDKEEKKQSPPPSDTPKKPR